MATTQEDYAQVEIVALTEQWCRELRGVDISVGMAAAVNVMQTLVNYAPSSELRAEFVAYLRGWVDGLESTAKPKH